MSVSVTLPQMGESVTEGTIIRWLKQEGEQVSEDEPIVEISTDKIDTELPAPASGVLSKIVVGPDQTVSVGAELAVIDEGGAGAQQKAGTDAKPAEETPPAPKQEAPAAEPAKPSEPAPAASAAPPPSPAPAETKDNGKAPADGAGKATLTPLVRKLARELEVDLGSVRGSGPGGRITKDDVISAARGGAAPGATSAPKVPPAVAAAGSRFEVPTEGSRDVPFDRVRKAIAEHMVRSLQTSSQLTTAIEVDMTEIVKLRSRAKDAFKATEGFSLTYMPFIASATVQALRAFPEFNAHVLEDGHSARLFKEVHLGVAVGRDEGLIVPVVHGADGMNLIGLARAINDVGTRARAKGQLKPDDVAGGTFTLTNFGSFGGMIDTPIINQPQVAILGIGAIQKRPAVIEVDGQDALAVRHLMFLCLTYDHRWIDGHKAAQFNGRLRQLLEEADFADDLGL